MKNQKNLMAEVALLYYKKGMTQQEIANALKITRQTVSKLLTAAVNEGVVEIKIHNPENERQDLQIALKNRLGVDVVVACTSEKNDELRILTAIEAAVKVLTPVFQEGGKSIGVSWGRTVQRLIVQFPTLSTRGNTVFPLFGATEHEKPCYLPNELARELASRIDARVKYAWFPYKAENEQDYELFRRTAYYKNMQKYWNEVDVAVLGIGNNTAFSLLDPDFATDDNKAVVGDVATHFFTKDGAHVESFSNTLRIDADSLKHVGKKIAIACGDDKADAIIGAIKAGLVDVLITDEYTARACLDAGSVDKTAPLC